MPNNSDQEAPVEPQEQESQEVEDSFYDDSEEPQEYIQLDQEEVSWKASEYIHHEKTMSWYFGLAGISIIFGVIIVLVSGSAGLISTISALAVLVVMTAALMIFAGRKPDTLSYHLDLEGLDIGPREYLLEDFRSFSLVQDGGVVSIVLAPLKRFMPAVSLYYDPKDEEAIVNILASILPHEEMELDFVDRLIRKARF